MMIVINRIAVVTVTLYFLIWLLRNESLVLKFILTLNMVEDGNGGWGECIFINMGVLNYGNDVSRASQNVSGGSPKISA